jgi:AcrR family transcriptional regulator
MTTADYPAPPRRLRRDAQRNRDAIVAAARQVFCDHGLEAPLEQIARQAGVGIATLHRHFPNRAALLDAVLTERTPRSRRRTPLSVARTRVQISVRIANLVPHVSAAASSSMSSRRKAW